MLKTTQVSLDDLAEGERAFKKITPALVRISSDPTTTKEQLHSFRKVLCPNDGPPHDAPLSDWKDWAEGKTKE